MNKNIFFSSDSHYLHKNIAGPKVSSWKSGYRDFDNEIEMSKHLVSVWNQTMKEDDILYFLGDWSFGGAQNIWNFRKQLKVKTIHFIYGNHDAHIKNNIVLPNVISDKPYSSNFIDGKNTDPEYPNYVEAQRLFTSCDSVLIVKHGQHTFFLSHYSHRVWDGSHKGVIHLYGHSHNSIPDLGKSMDVGVDSARHLLGEYRPFRIEEIIQIMNNKVFVKIDNHE